MCVCVSFPSCRSMFVYFLPDACQPWWSICLATEPTLAPHSLFVNHATEPTLAPHSLFVCRAKVEAALMRSGQGGCTEGAAANPRTKPLGGAHRVDSFQKWLDSAGWSTVLCSLVEIAGCLCLAAFPAIVLYHDMKHDTSLMGDQWEDDNGSSYWSKVSIVDLVGTLLSVVNWLLVGATAMMTLSNAHLPVLRAVATLDP
jgi:hypothetical protein